MSKALAKARGGKQRQSNMDSQDNVDEDQEEEEVMIQDGKESPSLFNNTE